MPTIDNGGLTMFKILSLIVIIILLVSGLAFAVSPPKHPKTGVPLVIDCLKGTPRTIDGNLSDWQLNYMTPAVLDTKEQIYPGVTPGAASWDGPNDCSGSFYVMWDDAKVYLGVIVKDDKLSMNKVNDTIWNADCIEIFFATTNAVPVGDHSQHYQYGFNANNQKWNWCNMDGNGNKEPDYLQIASSKTADGYICEASIDYRQMKSLKWANGEIIGFHPVLDDADDGDRELQMTWTGLEAHDQSKGFGQIILSSKLAAVGSEGKVVLTWGAIKNQ